MGVLRRMELPSITFAFVGFYFSIRFACAKPTHASVCARHHRQCMGEWVLFFDVIVSMHAVATSKYNSVQLSRKFGNVFHNLKNAVFSGFVAINSVFVMSES